MALADIVIETEGPAQLVTKVEIEGLDVTQQVYKVETGFEVGVGATTTLHFRGAAETTHDPDAIPFRDNGFQPDEPMEETDDE